MIYIGMIWILVVGTGMVICSIMYCTVFCVKKSRWWPFSNFGPSAARLFERLLNGLFLPWGVFLCSQLKPCWNCFWIFCRLTSPEADCRSFPSIELVLYLVPPQPFLNTTSTSFVLAICDLQDMIIDSIRAIIETWHLHPSLPYRWW